MKLLLDTHIWLWMTLEPSRLSPRVQQELQNKANQLWLSPVSSWETLLLAAKGKIDLKPAPVVWVTGAILQFKEAPLTHEIVVVSQQVALPHSDPADRFLAATAKVLGLTLVTSDKRLLGLGEIATLANH